MLQISAQQLAELLTGIARMSEEPMLDVRLFSNPRFSAASGAIALAFFSLFGAIFFLGRSSSSPRERDDHVPELGARPPAHGEPAAHAIALRGSLQHVERDRPVAVAVEQVRPDGGLRVRARRA